MSELRSDDKLFSQMMKKSRLEMPFSDFEDKMMLRIERESKLRRSISRDTKLAALFFVVGAGFGMVVSTILAQYHAPIAGIPSEKVLLYFQIVYVIVVLTQLENIIRLIARFR